MKTKFLLFLVITLSQTYALTNIQHHNPRIIPENDYNTGLLVEFLFSDQIIGIADSDDFKHVDDTSETANKPIEGVEDPEPKLPESVRQILDTQVSENFIKTLTGPTSLKGNITTLEVEKPSQFSTNVDKLKSSREELNHKASSSYFLPFLLSIGLNFFLLWKLFS